MSPNDILEDFGWPTLVAFGLAWLVKVLVKRMLETEDRRNADQRTFITLSSEFSSTVKGLTRAIEELREELRERDRD